MEDLGRDELIQLVTFYKQRASDLEFSLLQTQLKLNKASLHNAQEQSTSTAKTVVDKKIKTD